jgi:hypothetical protein
VEIMPAFAAAARRSPILADTDQQFAHDVVEVGRIIRPARPVGARCLRPGSTRSRTLARFSHATGLHEDGGSQTIQKGHGPPTRQISRMTGALNSCRRSHSLRCGTISPIAVKAHPKSSGRNARSRSHQSATQIRRENNNLGPHVPDPGQEQKTKEVRL